MGSDSSQRRFHSVAYDFVTDGSPRMTMAFSAFFSAAAFV
jgi:hypothetical protein